MILQLIILIAVCGIVWYFWGPYIAEPFRTIIIVLVLLVFCLWLLKFGGFNVPSLS